LPTTRGSIRPPGSNRRALAAACREQANELGVDLLVADKAARELGNPHAGAFGKPGTARFLFALRGTDSFL
jgi:hypothetical protein